MHRAGIVQSAPHRIKVVFEPLTDVCLRPQKCAIGLEHALNGCQRCPRMRHVVDTVEGHHQIEALAKRDVLSGDLLKSYSAGQSGAGRLITCALDRSTVDVITKEARLWKSCGHRDQALSRPAAHFGSFAICKEPLMNIRHRGDPVASDPSLVTNMEQALDRLHDLGAEVAERNAPAIFEGLHQLR